MTSPDTPAERALVALAVEHQQQRIDQAAAEMQADLDLYRDDWSSRHAEMTRAHHQRMSEIEADQRAWLARWLDGDDESAPTDVARQISQDASGSGGEPATPGPGSAGQPNPDAEMAERIRQTPMSAWAEERQQYLNRPTPGLFG